MSPRATEQNGDAADSLATGVLAGDRGSLARAITLVESSARDHRQAANALLAELLPHSGQSIRMGITGIPGAGKSTLIEATGLHLVATGKRVAVLAIDPGSSRSGGSILGDKTRMPQLARHSQAYIRPSPSTGVAGGVARKTRECILLCEAAGFDVILLETVGTGQGEVAARSMVDFFLLLLITGAGDGLQGIKRGVMELADAIVINKADGDNRVAALAAGRETSRALRLLAPGDGDWQTQVLVCSAQEGRGIAELWSVVEKFARLGKANGAWEDRRREQRRAWLHTLLEEGYREAFYSRQQIQASLPLLEAAVIAGEMDVSEAASRLLAGLQSDGCFTGGHP